MYSISSRNHHEYFVYKEGRILKKFVDLGEARKYVGKRKIMEFLKSPITNPLWYLPFPEIYQVLLHKMSFPNYEDAKRWVEKNGLSFQCFETITLFDNMYWIITAVDDDEKEQSWYEYFFGNDAYDYYRHLYDAEKRIF